MIKTSALVQSHEACLRWWRKRPPPTYVCTEWHCNKLQDQVHLRELFYVVAQHLLSSVRLLGLRLLQYRKTLMVTISL
jgi:hypothetical protein